METELTETPNPIEYESWITGPQGARFALYPIKDTHTEEDIRTAKHWLKNNRDVVSLQVRWKHQGDTTPNPEKIPDHLIIKNLQKEIGQEKSYSEELEDQLRKCKEAKEEKLKLTNADMLEIKKETLYKNKTEQIKSLELKIKKLDKDKAELLARVLEFQKNK